MFSVLIFSIFILQTPHSKYRIISEKVDINGLEILMRYKKINEDKILINELRGEWKGILLDYKQNSLNNFITDQKNINLQFTQYQIKANTILFQTDEGIQFFIYVMKHNLYFRFNFPHSKYYLNKKIYYTVPISIINYQWNYDDIQTRGEGRVNIQWKDKIIDISSRSVIQILPLKQSFNWLLNDLNNDLSIRIKEKSIE